MRRANSSKNGKVKIYSTRKKKKFKQKLKETYKNENGTQKETSIEQKVRIFLEENGLFFIQEKKIKHKQHYKSYDFYITDGSHYTFLVECDGDFFHPQKFSSKLNYVQKKNFRNDKVKNKIANELGIPLLRFREEEIKNNFRKVKKTILDEIKRQTGFISQDTQAQ